MKYIATFWDISTGTLEPVKIDFEACDPKSKEDLENIYQTAGDIAMEYLSRHKSCIALVADIQVFKSVGTFGLPEILKRNTK